MKVAFLTENFSPKIDGIVTRLNHTLFHLKKNDIEIMVLTGSGHFTKSFHANENGISVHRLQAFAAPLYPEKRLVIPTKKIKALLLSFNPDIIHVINPGLMGYLGLMIAKSNHIPCVVSQHSQYAVYLDYYNLKVLNSLIWKWITRTSNLADKVLCTSKYMYEVFASRGILHLDVWQPGVDSHSITPTLKNPTIRQSFNAKSNEDFLLLYVGRLSPEKNIELIKPALLNHSHLRLGIIGDGPHKNKLIKHFKGTHTIFNSFQNKQRLAALYASADAVILPSCTETLGLVLLEAMAAGTLVIGANAGGIPSLIEHGKNGFLCKPHSSEDISDILEILFQSEAATILKIKSLARRTAEQWSWENATTQLLNFYKEIIR